jgi:hypothetical protein
LSLPSSSYNQIEFCINFDDTNECPLETNDPVDQPMHILSQAFLGWEVLALFLLMVELNFCAQKQVYYLHGLEIGAPTIACLCLVLAQQLWIFNSPKDSTSCQLNFRPRQMRKPA